MIEPSPGAPLLPTPGAGHKVEGRGTCCHVAAWRAGTLVGVPSARPEPAWPSPLTSPPRVASEAVGPSLSGKPGLWPTGVLELLSPNQYSATSARANHQARGVTRHGSQVDTLPLIAMASAVVGWHGRCAVAVVAAIAVLRARVVARRASDIAWKIGRSCGRRCAVLVAAVVLVLWGAPPLGGQGLCSGDGKGQVAIR